MSKYKQIYERMIKENFDLFDSFAWVHEHYVKSPEKWQRTFNEEGYKIMEVIRKYENLLCGKSEGGGYAMYSANLADKFQQEIRKNFPKITHVGIQ